MRNCGENASGPLAVLARRYFVEDGSRHINLKTTSRHELFRLNRSLCAVPCRSANSSVLHFILHIKATSISIAASTCPPCSPSSPVLTRMHGTLSLPNGSRFRVLILFSARKQAERQASFDALPPVYSAPLSLPEQKIHALSLSQLVSECKAGEIAPADIMFAYAKKAVAAQAATNCVTDLMFDEALRIPAVANWPHSTDLDAFDSTRDRSLLGVPVSIKGKSVTLKSTNRSSLS